MYLGAASELGFFNVKKKAKKKAKKQMAAFQAQVAKETKIARELEFERLTDPELGYPAPGLTAGTRVVMRTLKGNIEGVIIIDEQRGPVAVPVQSFGGVPLPSNAPVISPPSAGVNPILILSAGASALLMLLT